MAIIRQGVWKCPSCEHHQTWGVRQSTTRLDRRCEQCGNRVRATLDRSSSGQGRRRNVQIWEREGLLDPEDLVAEAARRNEGVGKDVLGIDPISPFTPDEASQSDLPVIWGAGWEPASAVEFPRPLRSSEVRSELLRFLAERHDGHLIAAASCWDGMNVPGSFDGKSFHEFSREYVKELEGTLQDRLLNPSLSSVHSTEVIPRRTAEIHLERRTARLLTDVSLCLRRIAHHSSITIEQRMEWQRMMTRTRAVDEHLKDLFTKGIETPDGGSFGGKGFRSTWQEGIVACAGAMRRAVDVSPDERHRADVVAPMIRDVGLALAMGQTSLELFSSQMGN